jgi:hypothetical protein
VLFVLGRCIGYKEEEILTHLVENSDKREEVLLKQVEEFNQRTHCITVPVPEIESKSDCSQLDEEKVKLRLKYEEALERGKSYEVLVRDLATKASDAQKRAELLASELEGKV